MTLETAGIGLPAHVGLLGKTLDGRRERHVLHGQGKARWGGQMDMGRTVTKAVLDEGGAVCLVQRETGREIEVQAECLPDTGWIVILRNVGRTRRNEQGLPRREVDGLASDEKMATAGEDEGQLVFLMEMQLQGERGAPGHAHFFHVRMACPPVVPRGAGRHQGGGKREHDVVPGRRLVLDRGGQDNLSSGGASI